MNADVLTTRVADGIAVITLGSARRIYFDQEIGDALTEALDGFAGDAKVRLRQPDQVVTILSDTKIAGECELESTGKACAGNGGYYWF